MTFLQPILHYFFHLGFPLLVALLFFKDRWKLAYSIFLLTMLVDLDHLMAIPLFDACRCSINFHPLHTWPAILGYTALSFIPKIRLIAIGLLMHMATDLLDCFMSNLNCI